MTVPLVALIMPFQLKHDYLHILYNIYYVPVKIDIVVVFPAPLWPSNTVISFSKMFILKLWTATVVLYFLHN
jgi:hypothetical protein